jgi:hypothetical protein
MTLVEILVLGMLGLLSLFSGYYFKDAFIGLGSNFFSNIIYVLPAN